MTDHSMSATPSGPAAGASALRRDSAQDLHILDGDCWAFFAFDIGQAIDLDVAQRLLAELGGPEAERVRAGAVSACREQISHGPDGAAKGMGRRRVPASFQFRPAPLRIDQAAHSHPELAGVELPGFQLAPTVEVTLFDFGALSVAYRFPLGTGGLGPSLGDLLPLAQALFECVPLRDDATRRVAVLAEVLATAIDRGSVASLVEDYTVYHARRWSVDPAVAPRDAAGLLRAHGDSIARLLLAEPRDAPLSTQTVESALAVAVSYSATDAAVIDWNAALVLGADEADTLAVLEFANVELLEMRFLDDRLDAALDRSYAKLLRRDARGRPSRSPLGLLFDPHRAERRRLAAFQMDSAVLFEGVNNAIKLVGDQHLARIYAAAAKRFHLPEWDRSILRKQHTIDGLYQKLADEQANRRMEVLEWIIIILIAVSIVLPFIPGVGK